MPELLLVALFDLAHEIAAAKEVGAEKCGDGTRYNGELVGDHAGEVDGTASGNEMSAPLEHEADVPEDEESKDGGGDKLESAARSEKNGRGIEGNGEA